MMTLTEDEKSYLLNLARHTLEEYLATRQFTLKQDVPSHLKFKAAVFISLTDKSEIRGYAGTSLPNHFLCETVQSMVVQAASGTSEAPPLHSAELARMHIEISILKDFKKMKTVDDLEIGTHGVSITLGDHRGLLLPKVAVENTWDRVTFLRHVCQKAGLAPTTWRNEHAKVEIFSTETFAE